MGGSLDFDATPGNHTVWFIGTTGTKICTTKEIVGLGRIDWLSFSETRRWGEGETAPYPSDTGRAGVLDCGVAPRFGVRKGGAFRAEELPADLPNSWHRRITDGFC